jgi:hypothetical protein
VPLQCYDLGPKAMLGGAGGGDCSVGGVSGGFWL